MKNTITIFAIAAVLFLSCSRGGVLPDDLRRAEEFASSKPDSALIILDSTSYNPESGKYLYASYCLLKTYAEYNSYKPEIDEEQLKFGTDYFIRHGTRDRKALAYYLRAVVQQDQKRGSEADHVNDLQLAAREIKGSDNHLLASLIYLRYGIEMNKRKWYEASIPIFKQCIEESEKDIDKAISIRVSAYINLSHSELFLGDECHDYDKAIEVAQKAVEVSEGRDVDKSRALNALGACYSRSGQFDKSLESARTAVRIQEKLYHEGKRKEPVSYNILADAYRKNAMADSALFYASKGLDSPEMTTKMAATQLCYMIYRDLFGDDANSVKYMTLYNELKQQNESKLQSEKVIENRMKVEKEAHRSFRSRIIGTSIAVIIFLFAGGFVIVRVLRRNIRNKSIELEQKEKELDEVQPLLEQSESERSELRSVLMDKDKLVISLREKEHYLSDTEWSRLETILEKVCQHFPTRLRTEFPDITPAEMRIAVLLRFHFSGKQMAAMMGISPTSVTKSKQRLRGRVTGQMKDGENIDEFISRF